MTFTEAAVQVLRLLGKPLHYKEITDVAIEKDLLSHVGKSPEVTMGARLAAVLKKSGKDAVLVRVKPGVFALAEWSEKEIEKGMADRTPALELLAKRIAAETAKEAEALATARLSPAAQEESSDEDDSDASESEEAVVAAKSPDYAEIANNTDLDDDERRRAQMAAGASDLFEEEDDDDQPIFGDSAPSSSSDEEEGDDSGRGQRRGRGRHNNNHGGNNGNQRRGRGRHGGDSEVPMYTVSDAPADSSLSSSDERSEDGSQDNHDSRESRGRGRRDRRGRHRRNEGETTPNDSARHESARGESGRGDSRHESGRGDSRHESGRGDSRHESGRGEVVRGERRQSGPISPGDSVVLPNPEGAHELVALCVNWLAGYQRQGGTGIKQLAEQAIRKQLLPTDIGDASASLLMLLRIDNAKRKKNQLRELFIIRGSEISLSEWGIDRDAVKLEGQIRELLERYRSTQRRALLRKVSELPSRATEEFYLYLLTNLGFRDISVIQRPGAHPSELHLRALGPALSGAIATAIVIRRDGRDIGRERVMELRGTLHHFNAVAGLFITSGVVMSGAREEAATGGAPIELLDGQRLVECCASAGVGLSSQNFELPIVDIDFFDGLRG